MPVNIKEMIVVLALGTLTFALGKPTALHFMDEGDFKRRRNVWLLLSAVAFLSPSFWIFVLIAAPALYIGGRKDTNPLAFYLALMNVIPAMGIQIPTSGLGINQLFELDILRLLSFCVLIPAALRIRKAADPDGPRGLQGTDLLLLCYGLLTVVLYVAPDDPNQLYSHTSPTNILRQAFLFFTDTYVLYYVASRSCNTRRAIVDALAAFCLACAIMSLTAIFESVKHWLLYTDLYKRWGGGQLELQYLFRAGLLRAVSSTGNAIILGYLLAVALGFWLYLQSQLQRVGPRIAVAALLWLGLLASFSRGPLLAAILMYFTYAALRPGGASRLLKAAIAFVVVAAVILASPAGDKITATLPFMGGHVAQGTLTYREQLLARSWQLIQAHPYLGDQEALSKMQDLRQGQGIIDIVNTYLEVTLFYGFIGLALFLAFIMSALTKTIALIRSPLQPYPDWPVLGANLAACMIGVLLMFADCSFISECATTFFALIGIALAYSRISKRPASDITQASSTPSPMPG